MRDCARFFHFLFILNDVVVELRAPARSTLRWETTRRGARGGDSEGESAMSEIVDFVPLSLFGCLGDGMTSNDDDEPALTSCLCVGSEEMLEELPMEDTAESVPLPERPSPVVERESCGDVGDAGDDDEAEDAVPRPTSGSLKALFCLPSSVVVFFVVLVGAVVFVADSGEMLD